MTHHSTHAHPRHTHTQHTCAYTQSHIPLYEDKARIASHQAKTPMGEASTAVHNKNAAYTQARYTELYTCRTCTLCITVITRTTPARPDARACICIRLHIGTTHAAAAPHTLAGHARSSRACTLACLALMLFFARYFQRFFLHN